MLRGNFDQEGGRQIHNDDLKILQEEVLKAIELQYSGVGAFILNGCLVAGTAGDYSISAGLVFVNGKVMQFEGATGVASFPRYIEQANDIDQDSFPLENGGSAFKRTLVKAQLVSSVPSGEYIVMSASGGRNYNDVLSSHFVRLLGNQTINGQKNFTSNVISNGVDVNVALSNLSSSLTTKANNSVTVTGTDGLSGGGDLTANRTLNIANGGVSNAKLANGSVDANKLASAAVSVSKLATDVTDLFKGNFPNTDSSVDFTSFTTTGSRTYSSTLFTLTYNYDHMRPFVQMQCQCARDSGSADFVRLDLQRSNNSSSGFATIVSRTYRLDDGAWTSCVISTVDTGAFSGNNWYRLVVTSTSGVFANVSNNYTKTIFAVSVF